LYRLFLHNSQHVLVSDRFFAKPRFGQKAFKAFDELIAAGEITLTLRQ
jgi:hypothetical protein